ncbi:ATP-binding cassette domain-containing protein [Streptomyces sp. B8F3]|uniref:ATP-binding cassette domain-containing protein n=1 Tax=Streptomyces sp. B8F3 TaxID=3153573 RepID=UPI00325E9384
MRLDGVGRRYGRRGPWVLRGVDLRVPAGALVRVEGANGGGKSTLLRLLAGIDLPSAGRVADRPARTAYVPERFPAALPLTALGYLTHLGRVQGLRGAEARRRAGEWLERFGAGESARTPLDELSKGGSQKVAVAQALLAEPELLVLDEAWTGLDAGARPELDTAVAERLAAGGAVVFVDHDPRRLADVPYAAYRVGGGRVVARPAGGGPAVVVEAVGQPGARVPDDLPGAPLCEELPGGGRRMTVPAAHSDALLRALLDARPGWHIRGVHPLPCAPREDPAP